MNILITGATGFVGSSLCKALEVSGYDIRRSSLRLSDADWSQSLAGVETVIHLAARVHVMDEYVKNPLAEFRRVNVQGTRHLAESAAKAAVKRFVFVSSIGVNGEQSILPFTELDIPNPHNDYALSKWEAELALHKVSAETGMEVVIVRPPLVYGLGAPGNFAQIIKVLVKGIPLPLVSVQNLRSLIYVENLVNALILCATHPAAAGQTYLVTDGQDISTPDLLRRLSNAMGRSARLFPCPLALMRHAGRLLGKSDQIDKLVGSLQVDSTKIRRELGWKPPFALDEGLKATVGGK